VIFPLRVETETDERPPEFAADTPKAFGSRPPPLQQAASFFEQEFAHFSND
jgi:hypothetical protein